MKLISWNMNSRAKAWHHLAALMQEHQVDGALLQEAVEPPSEVAGQLQVITDASVGDQRWRTPVPSGTERKFVSALALRPSVKGAPWNARPLSEAAYGAPAISHPGQWVAARLHVGDETDSGVWVVSLYGLWDQTDNAGDIYAEATLHRAISDLTPLMQTKSAQRMIIAGDLNVWHHYEDKRWGRRYQTVFDRLEAYDLKLVGPHRAEGTTLQGCPCGGRTDCRHVQTYRHQRKPGARPFQNDYVFARGVDVKRCIALDEEGNWRESDHCPVLIEIGVR